MRLAKVDANCAAHLRVLYDLMAERTPDESISHKRMPSMAQHAAFVARAPYFAWYIIATDANLCGAVYLSKQDEIGIGVLKQHRGQGLATQAIRELMRLHPRDRYLANINPANEKSLALFRSLGFGGPIQVTLEKRDA